MDASTQKIIGQSAIAAGVVALLWLATRRKSSGVAVDVTISEDNIPIPHEGEAGNAYFNYNYPAIQGLPFDLSPVTLDLPGKGSCGPTCGCSETVLLGSNEEFQRYLQTRLTGFVDQYAEAVMEILPAWFASYLYNTGPMLSHLPALELSMPEGPGIQTTPRWRL